MKHYILRKKTARLVFIYYILRLLFFVVAPAYNKHRVSYAYGTQDLRHIPYI